MNALVAAEAEQLAEAFFFARDLFRSPGAEQWDYLGRPETRAAWSTLAERLELPSEIGLPASAADYETAYIAAFDAGAPHPPVPLIESHYNKKDPVPRILHENILFHQSFGVRLREASNETSDHLRHQLEFVGHLYKMEAEELRSRCDGEILSQIRTGRREFLERHVMTWLPRAAETASMAPDPWVARFVAMAFNLASLASQESEQDDGGDR